MPNASPGSVPKRPRAGWPIAHLQKAITLAVLLASGLWLVLWWPHSLVGALAGSAVLLLGFSGILALEFAVMHLINRQTYGSVTPGTRRLQELCKAWWVETRLAVKVFAWWQPFRAGAIPDRVADAELNGHRGMVLVHGLFCNRGFWTPWLRRLSQGPHAFVAVSLTAPTSSIDDHVAQIEAAVRRVTDASGMKPLLVCHSMGGLTARAWLAARQGHHRVHHVVTLGSPHQGTWLARFGHGRLAQQMQLGSAWLRQLDVMEKHAARQHEEATYKSRSLFSCWFSDCDNVIFPMACATLAGAINHRVNGSGHLQLAFLPEVMETVFALLMATPAPAHVRAEADIPNV